MALGDLAFEETGKFAGIRALPDRPTKRGPTGSGLKASWRGGVIWKASPGVWELDIDEGGNFHLEVWEWK